MNDDAKSPLVTVICSTYNSKATLRCALRSVLNQDLTDFEVLVMGDACTDGTEEIIAELKDTRLHWFNFPHNTGSQSEPNNEGMRRARGCLIAFIGHDDLWFPWHLSRLVRHLEQTGADLAHDLVASIGLDGVAGAYGPPHERSGYERVYFPTASWLHRRDLPEAIGFWRNPDELAWAIDFDFSRRAAQAGKKISCLPSLGVLKFHSQVWKFYSGKGGLPQEPYLDLILQDPRQINEKILTELATQFARQTQWNDKIPFSLAWNEARSSAKAMVKAGLRGLLYRYGHKRWPVGPLLRWRMRRLRANQRVARGLPSLKAGKP